MPCFLVTKMVLDLMVSRQVKHQNRQKTPNKQENITHFELRTLPALRTCVRNMG